MPSRRRLIARPVAVPLRPTARCHLIARLRLGSRLVALHRESSVAGHVARDSSPLRDRRLLLPLVAARRLFNFFNLRLLCSARLLLEQSRGGPDRHLPLVAAPRLFSLQLPCSARLWEQSRGGLARSANRGGRLLLIPQW